MSSKSRRSWIADSSEAQPVRDLSKLWQGIAQSLVLVFLLAAWYIGSRHAPEWMLPSPQKVIVRIASDWRNWSADMGATMLESVLGFLVGSTLGLLVGVLFAHSRALEKTLYPYAILVKTIPLVALAPMLTIWFPRGMTSKIIMGAVITFFPCIVNTVMGLRSASRETLELMASLNASRAQVFWKLRMPSALPSVFSALKITSTLSVIGAIVAEVYATGQAGLGYRLNLATEQTDMVTVVACVLLASVGGILFFGLVSLVERRMVYWLPQSAG